MRIYEVTRTLEMYIPSPIIIQHEKFGAEIELRCINNNKRSLDHCTVEWKALSKKR